MKQLILASASPRRKVLLQCMGLDFDVVPSNFEEYLDDARTPEEIAIELGLGKANDVAVTHPDSYVIGSDLIVVVDGMQLAKPETSDEARAMLRALNNRSHEEIASIAVICKSKNVCVTGTTTVLVTFEKIPDAILEKYIATGDAYDKAGGYSKQNPILKPYIRHSGDYHASVGISTSKLRSILESLSILVPNTEDETVALFQESSLDDQYVLI